MLGEVVVIAALLAAGLLVLLTRRQRSGKSESTAGHFDPAAIGSYELDPATLRYRYQLPTVQQGGGSPPPGSGPPGRRRRRRRRGTGDGE
jgi:hypothetical protein